jgi:hypothetical protein
MMIRRSALSEDLAIVAIGHGDEPLLWYIMTGAGARWLQAAIEADSGMALLVEVRPGQAIPAGARAADPLLVLAGLRRQFGRGGQPAGAGA